MTWRFFNKLCFRNNTKEHWLQWHGGAKEMAILGCKHCCPKLRNCRDVVGYSISQQVLSLQAKCGILSSKCLEFEKMMAADELGMQLVNAPTAPPVPRRQLWEGTASWVGWHVVSRISTLNHVQPLNILPFCIMLHHCTTPISEWVLSPGGFVQFARHDSQTSSSQRLVNVRREKLAPTHFKRALGARDLSYERGTVGSEAAANKSNHAKLVKDFEMSASGGLVVYSKSSNQLQPVWLQPNFGFAEKGTLEKYSERQWMTTHHVDSRISAKVYWERFQVIVSYKLHPLVHSLSALTAATNLVSPPCPSRYIFSA